MDQTALATLAISSTSPQFTAAGGTASISFQKGAAGNFVLGPSRTTPINMPASTVEMRDAFRVTNRSAICQNVSVAVPGGSIPNLASIKGRTTPPPSGTPLAGAGGTGVGTFALGAGQTLMIDVRWTATTNPTSAGTFRILVSGLKC